MRTKKNFARFARAHPLHQLFMSDPPLTKFLHPPLDYRGWSNSVVGPCPTSLASVTIKGKFYTFVQTDMSASWSNGLASCCTAYWLCDCSKDCCLACDASWAAYRPDIWSVQLLGEIGRAAGIND